MRFSHKVAGSVEVCRHIGEPDVFAHSKCSHVNVIAGPKGKWFAVGFGEHSYMLVLRWLRSKCLIFLLGDFVASTDMSGPLLLAVETGCWKWLRTSVRGG